MFSTTEHMLTNWLTKLSLMLAVVLVGCANEPPPIPPAELTPTSASVRPLKIWSANVGEAGRGRFEPQILEEQLVSASRSGKVISYSRDNGIRQWSNDLKVRLTSGVSGDETQVYVGDIDGVLHALDRNSGESKWSARGSSEILVPASANYGALIVRSTDGRVVSLDPASGEELWTVSHTPPALSLNGYSRPLLLDGGVLLGLDDGRLLALNTSTGKLIWEAIISVPSGRSEVERLVDIDADIVVDDNGIYLANYQGKATRLEPVRGQTVWSVPLSAGSGLAVSEDSVVVIDDEDSVHRFDKNTGQLVWINSKMPGRRLSPPAFNSEGDIVVGDTEGYIHVIDFDTGELAGRARLGKQPIVARPIASEEAMYIQSTNGTVAAYRFTR